MIGAATVPVICWTATAPGLGTSAELRLMAGDAAPLDEAMLLLRELTERWGPTGELAAVAAAPTGHRLSLSAESVLLLTLLGAHGVEVDVTEQEAWRTGPTRLPDDAARHALAADLLVAELLDTGGFCALVGVGTAWRASGPALNGGSWRVPLAGASTGYGQAVELADGGLVVVPSPADPGGSLAVTAPQAWQAWLAAADAVDTARQAV